MFKRLILVVLLCILYSLSAVISQDKIELDKDLARSSASITAQELRAHIKFLSDDLCEGRLPGSRGEDIAIRYIAAMFEAAGLKAPYEGDSYFQKVPLVGITADPDMVLKIGGEKESLTLKYYDDFMGTTEKEDPEVTTDAPVVFVGYGIEAPEQNWDDYKGMDMSGKVLLMLINDPPATEEEPNLFGGKAMTYYGRWTYKYEIAAQKGAVGAIIIHTTEMARYPWSVIQSSWYGEKFRLESEGERYLNLESWITKDAAEKIFHLAGYNLEDMMNSAKTRDFKPVPFKLSASVTIKNKSRHINSHNVVGVLEGSDPELKAECIVYSAHWDHLGIGKPVDGDNIYNGALDNATGVAGMIENAEAFCLLNEKPKRSVVFVAVTAEEQGLLGSAYYAAHPIFPQAKTAANINTDALNIIGATRDLTVLGFGRSTLDEHIIAAAQEQGRKVEGDHFPENGSFYRSDQFSFAKQGIPVLYINSGIDYVGRDKEWVEERRKEYIAKRYHQPSDEYSPDWNFEGMVQDTQVSFLVGVRIANTAEMPQWNKGDEFEKVRLESIKNLKLERNR
jgi:Zn-dependent M28 family amino/carboxypeptidase